VSAAALLAILAVYNKLKSENRDNGAAQDLYRLEQKIDKIGYRSENNAQSAQGFVSLLISKIISPIFVSLAKKGTPRVSQ